MMSKYLQVVWLYIIGLIIILFGVYMLMNTPGPTSFVVMLVGLGVAAVGSAHGRKMRQMGPYGLEDLMREGGEPLGPVEAEAGKDQEKFPEEPLPEQGQAKAAPEQAGEAAPEEKAAPEGPPEPKRGGIMSIFRRGPPGERLMPDDVVNIELEDIKSGKLVPTEADVIELVCPRCGAENEEKNFYCYSCGNKLRRKPGPEAKTKKEMKVEPGAIALVGEQRVAKVIVCPKCNAANKESDKFCFNCGKKLRAERVKKKAAKPFQKLEKIGK